jgi:hypothetical protein
VVTADVKNTGTRKGDEVAQLYLSFNVPGIELPVKQLRGFERISLEPGQTATVKFLLSPNELYYFNETVNSYVVAPGTYVVKIGGSSDSLPLSGIFQISQTGLKPDLKIANILTVPRYPLAGDSVIFLATVINRGTGPSPAGNIQGVTFSLNGQQISKSTNFTGSIPAGGMALVCGNLGINGSNSWVAGKPGSYNIGAVVNEDKTIPETIDTNNTASGSVTVSGAPPVNLALNKPVTVSSVENASLGGQNAVDGNLGTRWSSLFSDPQYITIDLQSVQTFNEILITWETAYAKEYEVQISNNGSDWTTLAHQTNGTGGTEKISVQASARYVRIYGIKRATQYGYSIYEIDIYNEDISSTGHENKNLPSEFTLSNNYPNPFNPSTTIEYKIPKAGHVKLEIFNSVGELINTLRNDFQNQGKYSIQWDGKNARGKSVPSGIYFYKMSANGLTLVKKMLLIK